LRKYADGETGRKILAAITNDLGRVVSREGRPQKLPPHPKLTNHGLRCKECPVGNPMEATQALWKNLNISDAGRLDEFWTKRVSLIQGTAQAALPRTIFQILTRGFLQIPHIAPQ